MMQIGAGINLQLGKRETGETAEALGTGIGTNGEGLNKDAPITKAFKPRDKGLGVFNGIEITKLSHHNDQTP